MKQVVGYVHNDGQSGGHYAGGFDVEKTEPGTYKINFSEPFYSYPVVMLTPVSGQTNANAVLVQAYSDYIIVLTSFTDKEATEYADCSFFFTAVCRD